MKRGRLGQIALGLFCALVLAFLLFPILAIVAVSFTSGRFLEFPLPGLSFRWYAALLEQQKWIEAAARSLAVALMTVGLSTLIGTLAAIGVASGRIPGAAWIRQFVLAPLIIPKVVTAVALFMVLAPLELIGSNVALVLGHTVATNTLPKLMYSAVQEEITPVLAAVSAIMIGVTIAVGAFSGLVMNRRRT
jgi:putative spermidine/putrescine transport system permease protein